MDVQMAVRNLSDNYDKPLAALVQEAGKRLGELAMVNYRHQIYPRGCSETAAMDETMDGLERAAKWIASAAQAAFEQAWMAEQDRLGR